MAQFGDHYRSIYLAGAGGQAPSIPIAWRELAARAEEALGERAAAYVFGSAGSGDTALSNRRAFDSWRIVPRMLRDVAERDLSTTVLGTELPAPLAAGAGRGPERSSTQTASWRPPGPPRALGVPMIAGTTAGHSRWRTIAEAGGDAPRWFQLYWPNDPEIAESFVSRAEAAGYEAIVVTVDTFIPGWKPRDLQQAWLPFLEGVGLANYFQDPVFRAGLDQSAGGGPGRGDRPLPRRLRQPRADLGRPRLAARA